MSSTAAYGAVPNPSDNHLVRGYGAQDFASGGNPVTSSPLSQSAAQQPAAFHEDFDASQQDSSVLGENDHYGSGNPQGINRSASSASTAVAPQTPSRSATLRKKTSMRRSASAASKKSIRRSSSKRSLKAGSIAGVGREEEDDNFNSVFNTPIPTHSSPTDILANRFQAWRQLLKSLITYFREIANSYDTRAKAVHKVQNTISNITNPSQFMSANGIGEATRMLEDYHKRSISEANKSRDIENDVIGALTGLRSDLGQKIKEIKSLSGDFKNSVEKEKDSTKREVERLQEVLQHADHEDGGAVGKNDPFVIRLGVERAIERQIDEENYLHRAYLNLENSGRELESIVVGEIQKAYNALAGILKREADDAYHVVDNLRGGPVAMPKDQEWMEFVTHDPHFVDPSVPIRRIEDIEYPGKDHPAAAEVRAGMLERKSKYLKSYTPGWYVLSPTHLHEFKSADKIYSQPPVMSLYLLDQKLGSKSDPDSSSHKFMLKGKQSGNTSMHKGHNWVFRAESHETMLAWYNDIKMLTETSGEQRDAFVRKHARRLSGLSDREGTVSSDGMEDDEADAAPYSADAQSLREQNPVEQKPQRPQPGGRFPSDLQVPRQGPHSPSSESSEPEALAAAGAIPASQQDPYRMDGVPSSTRPSYEEPRQPAVQAELQQRQAELAPLPNNVPPPSTQGGGPPFPSAAQPVEQQQPSFGGGASAPAGPEQYASNTNGDWIAPAAAGVAGVGAGAVGTEAYRRHQQDAAVPETQGTNDIKDGVMPQTKSQWAGDTTTSHDNAFAANAGMPSAVGGTRSPNDILRDAQTRLGGLENKGAHETGRFPTVVRHDTDMSVSALHVPGQFPSKS
ncbi:hypothetical protein KC367_g2216 [Hortaea werneckii]|nr:hypothetical protein KC367_g2216 [Hortaea werneckii]